MGLELGILTRGSRRRVAKKFLKMLRSTSADSEGSIRLECSAGTLVSSWKWQCLKHCALQ